jgi:electron transport complex protein RnfG
VQAKEFWKKAYPVIILTAVVAVSVTALTYTDRFTRGEIEAQMETETEAMLSEMFPEMSRYELANDIYTIYSNGDRLGYAFIATGKGYGGDIDILVGLEDENTVKGITIISNEETPGLGTRITEPSFTNHFEGLSIDEVALRGEGGEIDAITGSTISSAAVIDAVRAAAQEKVRSIEEGQDG